MLEELSVIFIPVALIFSAFFSGIEIAFVSQDKLKLQIEMKKKKLLTRINAFFFRFQGSFITSLLIGNNLALVFYSMLMEKQLEALPFGIQIIIITLVVLVFAEYLPKVVFRLHPNFLLKLFAIPLLIIYVILFPAVYIATFIAMILLRVLLGSSVTLKREYILGKIDLVEFVERISKSTQEKTSHEPIKFFQNTIALSSTKVRNCMVPRRELVAIDTNEVTDQLNDLFVSKGLSKVLVYENSIDHVIGYYHSIELFNESNEPHHMIPVLFVPETFSASKLLQRFINEKSDVAIVVDEFGGTAGMVTTEDILEEIFGDIQDEFDTNGYTEKKIDEFNYLFSARLEITYLNERYNMDLPVSENFNTLSGMIIEYAENIPPTGTTLEINHFTIKIINSGEGKIETIQLTVNPDNKKTDT